MLVASSEGQLSWGRVPVRGCELTGGMDSDEGVGLRDGAAGLGDVATRRRALVPKKCPKFFTHPTAHQILRYIHEILNVVKKYN